MTQLREHWEGVCLSGEYTLEQWLGGDDSAAFFQTSLADGRRAVVKLVPETTAGGVAQLDLWRRTRQLRHPNLIELFDCGRTEQGGELVLYAVFESPDDTLACALSRSPLNPQEAREVLDCVIDALRYLHAQGLVLGALDPDHIVAVGERIKLSTGALREADTSSAYRDDVLLLGRLWQQALMAASPRSPEIAAHAADPNPQARWTLAEISAALDPPRPSAPPPAPPVAVPPIPVAPAGSCEEILGTRLRSAETEGVAVSRPEHPRIPSQLPVRAERAAAGRFPKWVFAGAAGVVLLIVLLSRPRPSAVATQPRVAVTLPAETPSPRHSPEAAVPAAPAVPAASPAAGTEIWRVIAFTYRTRAAAEKKVQQLNQDHPGLNAAVFSIREKRGYYLVSLGGRMTHEEAVRIRRNARGKGLPRDLYVQNYAE